MISGFFCTPHSPPDFCGYLWILILFYEDKNNISTFSYFWSVTSDFKYPVIFFTVFSNSERLTKEKWICMKYRVRLVQRIKVRSLTFPSVVQVWFQKSCLLLNPQTEIKSLCFQHRFDVTLGPNSSFELSLEVLILLNLFKHTKKRPWLSSLSKLRVKRACEKPTCWLDLALST